MPAIKVARGPAGGWRARFDGHTTVVGGHRTRSEARAHLIRLAADTLEHHHRIHVIACADGTVLVVRWLVDGWAVENSSRHHPVARPCRWVRYPTAGEALGVTREEAGPHGGVEWESVA